MKTEDEEDSNKSTRRPEDLVFRLQNVVYL